MLRKKHVEYVSYMSWETLYISVVGVIELSWWDLDTCMAYIQKEVVSGLHTPFSLLDD